MENKNESLGNKNEPSMNIPKKKNVALLTLLGIITFGIYYHFWFLKRVPELNNLRTKAKSKKALVITAFTLYILSAAFYLGMWTTAIITDDNIATINILDVPLLFQILFGVLAVLLLTYIAIILMVAFEVRSVLNEALLNKGIKRKASGFFTFFFNFLYLQYEINRIVDDTEMEKRVGPWIWFTVLYIIPTITLLTLYILDLTGVYSLP